jgi:hypothetical protein
MRVLSLEDFQGRAGERFTVDHDGAKIALVLTRVVPLPQSARDGEPFRLDWSGPAEPLLPQGIYLFSGTDQPFEMFIVPVGVDAEGARYEAIFN